tara:strand:+ start:989 stop:1312 length:324 start_codon:yes stop_codon:yes gene_type:complete
MNWINLTNIPVLDKIKQDSFHNPQFIFKHSTRCSISKMVLSRFESTYDTASFSVYLLDLLNYRDLSNQIEDDFNVKHESPQLLVINKGECNLCSSHTNINQINIADL